MYDIFASLGRHFRLARTTFLPRTGNIFAFDLRYSNQVRKWQYVRCVEIFEGFSLLEGLHFGAQAVFKSDHVHGLNVCNGGVRSAVVVSLCDHSSLRKVSAGAAYRFRADFKNFGEAL